MTTNSKNSRMKYRGFNNNRLYQQDLAIKREKRKLKKESNKFIFNVLKSLGLVFGCFIGYFIANKQKEEAEVKKIEKKIEEVKAQQERNRKAAERKAKKEAKDNELIDQWTKNMGKFINGKYITISLEDYRKMTDKERKEWNEIRKKEESGIILL